MQVQLTHIRSSNVSFELPTKGSLTFDDVVDLEFKFQRKAIFSNKEESVRLRLKVDWFENEESLDIYNWHLEKLNEEDISSQNVIINSFEGAIQKVIHTYLPTGDLKAYSSLLFRTEDGGNFSISFKPYQVQIDVDLDSKLHKHEDAREEDISGWFFSQFK